VAYSVLDLLSYVPLMKPIETVKTGIPNVLPPEFFSVTEDIPGHVAEVVEMPGTRKVARVAPYGTPPRLVDKVDLSIRPLTLLHTIEEMSFRDELFRWLREWDRYQPMQQRAVDEIARQGAQFVARQDNLDVAVVTSMLANGIAWFDGNGNLLPSASGTKLTVDQGIPANNKNQLNGIVSASWGTASTDIVGQINAIKVQAAQLTGYKLKYAIYGQNIPGYFAKNDSIKPLWQYNMAYNQSFLTSGQMPREMLELIWIPAMTAFYEDDTGTVRSLFPADQVTFTPEINSMTYAYLRGSYPVPKGFAWGGSAENILSNFADVYGRFRYAYAKVNPSGIVDTMGNTFMPRFKVPNAFFLCDTTP
jgi:hypothetical protein